MSLNLGETEANDFTGQNYSFQYILCSYHHIDVVERIVVLIRVG